MTKSRKFLFAGMILAATSASTHMAIAQGQTDTSPQTPASSTPSTEHKLIPLPERAYGDPKAPNTVDEWFSYTCTHCAAFSTEVFPQINEKLIKTGKVRYIFHDYPLDRLALAASAAATHLSHDAWLQFTEDLLSSQQSWAFTSTGIPLHLLEMRASLAGISNDDFVQGLSPNPLTRTIIANEVMAAKNLKVTETPSFRFNGGPIVGGEITYEAFVSHLAVTP